MSTETPAEVQSRRRTHYLLTTIGTAAGAVLLLLGCAGLLGVSPLTGFVPWLLLISLFFLIPGISGLVRGPGKVSTYIIPRPKARMRTGA